MPPASRASKLNVVMIASEMAPWAKTGGLADVLSGLPAALDSLGHRVTVVLPRYTGVHVETEEIIRRQVRVGPVEHEVRLHVLRLAQAQRVVFVDHPQFFGRDGIYGRGTIDYADNDQRFGLLSAAALDFVQDDVDQRVDVIHTHDWQAGIAP